MSASSVASSTLTRSRIAMLSFATLATVCAGYWLYQGVVEDGDLSSLRTSTLHRSNAIHRRRRRIARNSALQEDLIDEDDPAATATDGQGVFVDDEDQASDAEDQALDDGTVVDDQDFPDEYGWTNPPMYQRTGQNIVQLLFRVSEDATRRNAYVHRGCGCNSCNMLPIRGIRYRCANCADYDLCEGCESQGLHTKTHIFYKIRVPASSFGPRHMQPVWYPGDPDSALRVLPKETLTRLSRETGFERPELDAYWEQWTFMANTDWRDDPDDINLAMDRRTFERCLVPSGGQRHAAPNLIFDRMFAFYDTNKDDLIGFPEFLHGVAYRKKKDKWRKIFEGYDIDEDGYVDRKDFLRMFRSYYVLHRQIHRDMIEGAEEQQMSSKEAHRLISSRQPLSSAFGQDGRYPRAPDPRTGEGKTVRANGDLEITDGKGIMTESGDDTGRRDGIFRRARPMPVRSEWDQERTRLSAGYWETILDPPTSVEQMPDVLRNLQRIRGQVAEILHDDPAQSDAGAERVDGGGDEQNENTAAPNSAAPVARPDQPWPQTRATVTDEDAEAIIGPGATLEDVKPESRQAVTSHAVYREREQREIYDRWQRRHFYTDEEEGSAPPEGWKDDDDILAQPGMVGESSKSASRPSIHSRSSSKVRFAEDMDDFDTRSNPSTSSRSIPERWGGMDIPDAERDAGKEILYQVTQQAFNELLDPLFKTKEDLALRVARRKKDLDKYRPLYKTDDFEKWASEKFNEATKPKAAPTATKDASTTPLWPDFPEIEVEQVRERPLEELLAATGYQVDASLAPSGHINNGTPEPEVRPETPEARFHATMERMTETEFQRLLRSPFILSSSQRGSDDQNWSGSVSPPFTAIDNVIPGIYRDPTMPQFRPDNDRECAQETTSPSSFSSSTPALSPVLSPSHFNDPPTANETAALQKSSALAQAYLTWQKERDGLPVWDELYEMWKLDRAREEAKRCGGWGRMGFEEFERVVKKAVGEGRGSQMDYLGSWIEFCIP